MKLKQVRIGLTSKASYPKSGLPIVNGALYFDSSVEIDMPVEFWMNTNGNCSGNKVMVGRDDGTLHWWVGCSATGNAAHFGLKDTTRHYEGVTGTTAINDCDWHHIVAVRDEIEDKNRIYVDGVEENNLTWNYIDGLSSTTELNIG